MVECGMVLLRSPCWLANRVGDDCGAPGVNCCREVLCSGQYILEPPWFVVNWREVCENMYLLCLIRAETAKCISGTGVQVECGQGFGSRHAFLVRSWCKASMGHES